MKRWLALAAILGTGACSSAAPQATEVMVEIDAETNVRARLARLTVEIRGGPANAAYDEFGREQTYSVSTPELPLRAAIVPLKGDATRLYLVTVTAYDDAGDFLAQSRLVSGYVPRTLRYVRVLLEDACLGVETCIDGEGKALTCSAGSCRDPRVSVEDLENRPTPAPTPRDMDEDASLDGGGTDRDGGVDAAGPGMREDGGPSNPNRCKLGVSRFGCKL